MAHSPLIKSFELYYGAYPNDYIRNSIDRYLFEFKPDQLEKLLRIVKMGHPLRFGPPCIATIENIHQNYIFGDKIKGLEGHKSLKKEELQRSACSPSYSDEPIITADEKREELRRLKEENPLIAIIYKDLE